MVCGGEPHTPLPEAKDRLFFSADFIVALATGGGLWTFGDNTHGQLASGDLSPAAAPVAVPGLTGIVELSGGARHTLALGLDGRAISG